MDNSAGKGDKRRKSCISVAEEDLRWTLAFGNKDQKQDAEIKLKKLKCEEFGKSAPAK